MTNNIVLRTEQLAEVLTPTITADQSTAIAPAMLANEEWMQARWDELAVAWLQAKYDRTGSEHTLRNYERILVQWRLFMEAHQLRFWQVEARHVREWQRHLLTEGRMDVNAVTKRGQGLREVTVNSYMSGVSSFYTFVINEKRLVQGRELCLFLDVTGAPRANPFRYGNVPRLRVEEYDRAAPLEPIDLARLVRYLEKKSVTLSGARNYALVTMYLLTGYRNAEVLRMQWKHLRASRAQRGAKIYSWQGKGGKQRDEAVPQDAWQAIVHYLKLDGRWREGYDDDKQELDGDDYIFRATVRHTLGHLRFVRDTVNERNVNEPLSEKSAVRILRTALRNAGVRDFERYRIHDLRHTFARMMLDDNATETEIMDVLHHASLETTGRYTKRIRKVTEDPVDVRSQRLYQRMRSGKDSEQ